jgi:hypothetical protein
VERGLDPRSTVYRVSPLHFVAEALQLSEQAQLERLEIVDASELSQRDANPLLAFFAAKDDLDFFCAGKDGRPGPTTDVWKAHKPQHSTTAEVV